MSVDAIYGKLFYENVYDIQEYLDNRCKRVL